MNRTAEVHKGALLALLAASQFVVVLDASITNVALPSIGRALDISQDGLSWVVNAYTLTFGGFLLLGGRLADLLGRRRVYMAGLILFGIASFLGGIAQSDPMLITARALQGLGAALLSPAALSILTATFTEGAERNKALGVWGAVAGAGGAAGVLLGGILTEYLSWRWVLLVNVPIVALAAFLAPRIILESRAAERTQSFDVAGAISVTAGVSLLVYALVDANNNGWGSALTIALLALATLLLLAFVVIERRVKAPLVPGDIFASRTRTASYVIAILIAGSLFSMFFFISLYMQQVLGWSAIRAGLSYLPLAITIVISAGVASQVVNRVGFKPVLATGLGFIAVAMVWWAQVDVGGTFLSDVLGPSLVAAVGLGLSFVSVTVGGTSGVEEREAGLASGLINAAQQVGGALGLAVLVAVANARTDAVDVGRVAALNEGFQAAFLGGAVMAAVGVVLTLTMVSREASRSVIGAEASAAAAG
jgi:EmrB/QacA subfamily drug resistance transporter